MPKDGHMPYHFIGIGGDGMSALAWILHDGGYRVSGSDLRESPRTQQLRAAGIPVRIGHHRDHVGSSEVVIFSSAVDPENVELRAARATDARILHRQQLLANLLESHRSIAVAGTHGKTTIAAMIAALLLSGGRDPSFLVGAASATIGGHARLGLGEWLVAEIDESDGHFSQFRSDIAVVANVGYDHLNYYGSRRLLGNAFRRFVSGSRLAVLSSDDPGCPDLRRDAEAALTFGLERSADLVAHGIEYDRMSTRAHLSFRGEYVGELELRAPGRHNVSNALASLLVGHAAGLDFERMLATLQTFLLPDRRFQVLEENGRVVVDDYAHLPDQIEANLAAVRGGWGPERVIAVFQPHRYSRMSYMIPRFARAFRHADMVIVCSIYPAFERPIPGVDASSVAQAISDNHEDVHHLHTSESVCTFLSKRSQPGDFIIGFGPGDIWQVLHRVVEGA